MLVGTFSKLRTPAVHETGESGNFNSGAWLKQVRDAGFDDVGLWDVVVDGSEPDWHIFMHALDRAASEQADVVRSIAITQARDPVDGIPGETVRIHMYDAVVANARMFSHDEIEVDFDHRDLTPADAHAVLFVMGLLGDAVGRPTRLAAEGDHRIVAMTYEPSSKQYRPHR